MGSESVTLRVNIYHRHYDVRYPSQRKVDELMLEFATHCKGKLKPPPANRRYFVCIHCGKDDFSGKLMLNQHRYEEGCDGALYPDGSRALLLPYPDFLPGQGKIVEDMGQTLHQLLGFSEGQHIGDNNEGHCTGGSEELLRDSDPAPCRNAAPVKKKVKTRVTEAPDGGTFKLVTPSTDIFCGRAPPRKNRKSPQGGQRVEDARARESPSKDPVKGNIAGMVEKDPVRGGASKGIVQQRIAAVERLRVNCNIHGAFQGGPPGGTSTDHHPNLSIDDEAQTDPRGEPGGIGISTNDNKRKREGRGDVSDVIFPPDVEPATEDPLPMCGDPVTPSAEENQFRPQVEPSPYHNLRGASPVEAKDGSPSVLKAKSRSKVTIREWAVDLIRVHQKEKKTLEEEFQIAAGMGAARALEEEYRLREMGKQVVEGFNECRDVDADFVSDGLAVECHATAPLLLHGAKEDTPVTDSLRQTELEHTVEDEMHMAIEDEVKVLGENSGIGNGQETMDSTSVPLDSTTTEPGVYNSRFADVIAAVTVWERDSARGSRMGTWWAEGEGIPMPYFYTDLVQGVLDARNREMETFEETYVQEVRSAFDEKIKTVEYPPPPQRPLTPGLGSLHMFTDAVLPWTWEAHDEEDFRRRWEEHYWKPEFEAKLRDCLWWWTVRKGEKAMTEEMKAVREEVSAAIETLVACRTRMEPYSQLGGLCNFFQYTRDLAAYEALMSKRVEAEENERKTVVDRARVTFQKKSARLREKTVWDWSPLWQVLAASDDMYSSLPETPWCHDGIESREVRRRLLRDRVTAVEPVLLLFAMKMFYTTEYGMFRPISCPVYGITTDLIRDVCMDEFRMARILHVLVTHGPYFCAFLGRFEPADLLRRLHVEATLVRQGRGDYLFNGMLTWVKVTQKRALQDYAAATPDDFDEAWTTTKYVAWESQAKHWARTLLKREDGDLEWIACPVMKTGSAEVVSLRRTMRDTAERLAKATRDEDSIEWEKRHEDRELVSGGNERCDGSDQQGIGGVTPLVEGYAVVGAVSSIPFGISVSRNDHEDPDAPRAPHTTVDRMQGTGPHRGVSEGGRADKRWEQMPLVAEGSIAGGTVDVQCTTSVQIGEVGESTGLRFHSEETQRGANEIGVTDVPAEEATLADWVVSVRSPTIQTSLLNAPGDLGIKGNGNGGDEDERLVEVYEYLKLEKLLAELPGQGQGAVRKPETVFYNHCKKELEVTHEAIRGLKRLRTRLGNDIVDFVMSRVYLTYPGRQRHEIHIVSSRVSGHWRGSIHSPADVRRFGLTWLQPPPGVDATQVKDLILPWVCEGHWSVLVFRTGAVLHMDSTAGSSHHPNGEHADFVRWISNAWQCLRGVQPDPAEKVVTVPVFRQPEDYECGHFTIRNVIMYLKYRTTISTSVDGYEALLKPTFAKEMNIEILVLLSKELSPTLRDKRLPPPFCPLTNAYPHYGEDCTLLMEGGQLAVRGGEE